MAAHETQNNVCIILVVVALAILLLLQLRLASNLPLCADAKSPLTIKKIWFSYRWKPTQRVI